MHILSTIDSVQNFYTRSSEALSPFYKCFVIPLWWRRDTFTEDYSARDINHHLENKAAICLEGFLESTKAKFNKTSLGSHRGKNSFPEGWSRALLRYFTALAHVLWGTGIAHPLPAVRRKAGPPEPELDLPRTPAEIETSPRGFDFDTDLLLDFWVPSIQPQPLPLQNHSGAYQWASTWHKAGN